jgi:hypothetical protein
MEVLDLIYHQFFFTANSLGRQPTTSQFFQPLTPQTLALVAAAIHCVLSEYATGKKVTVMFSQDEYRGKFCPSTVIDCIIAEATALLINYTWWAASYPTSQWCSYARIGAPQSPSALLNPLSDLDLERLYVIPDSELPSPFCDAQHGWLLRWMGAPQPPSALLGPALLPSVTFPAPPSTSALPLPTLHSTSGTPHLLVAHLFFLRIHHIPFQTPF